MMKKLLPAALLFAISSVAHSAPGDLDTSFGGTGMVRIGFGFGSDAGVDALLQPDGMTVMVGNTHDIAGDFSVLWRYTTNGLVDSSFGTGGKAFFTNVAPATLAIQSDGKILVAGTFNNGSNDDFALLRYNTDGSLDSSFGSAGLVTTDLGTNETPTVIYLQPDNNKIVVGGYSTVAPEPPPYAPDPALAVVRYNTNGTLDTLWNGTGKLSVPSCRGQASAIIMQNDGKLLVAGGTHGTLLCRFNTNGTFDTTFNGTGILPTPGNALYYITALAIQSSSTFSTPDLIVAAGQSSAGYPTNIGVARYNLDGSPDTTFNSTGMVVTAIGLSASARSLILQGGFFRNPLKIVVAGTCYTATNSALFEVRYAANGTLDTTFNGTGKLVTQGLPPSMAVNSVRIQGSYLATAGSIQRVPMDFDFSVARFNLGDGTYDTSFNGTGWRTDGLGNLNSSATCIAVQTDGKIVVAGRMNDSNNDWIALVRLNVNGSLDNTFGVGGKTTATNNPGDSRAIVLQPDGKLVVGGDGPLGFRILRFLPNGTLDATFNGTGIVDTSPGTNAGGLKGIALQPDGKIVAAGSVYVGGKSCYGLVRLNPNGSLDTAFDGDGKVTTSISSIDDEAWGVAIQADGKIVAGGDGSFGTSVDFSMVRYNPNGSTDGTFGLSGRVTTDFYGSADGAFAVAIQPNGKVVEAGVASHGPFDFAVARYNTNGSLDTTFNGTGKATTQIAFGNDYAQSLAIEPNGKLVLAGVTHIATAQFAAVRYTTDGLLDTSFGSSGKVILDFGTPGDQNQFGLAVDAQGRSIIVGDAGGIFAIARLMGDPILKITSIQRLGNGHMLLSGVGVPGGNHTLSQTIKLNPSSFNPLAPITADANGLWQYEDATVSVATNRFYRLSFP